MSPGDMPSRITDWLTTRGAAAPRTPGEIARCIMDSLALAHRRAVLAVQSLSGRHADVVHIVGGGSRASSHLARIAYGLLQHGRQDWIEMVPNWPASEGRRLTRSSRVRETLSQSPLER